MSLEIHVAHSAESLPDDDSTYLGVIAQIARDDAPGQSVVPVSFWIQTNLADTDTRTAQAALHAARVAALLNLFDDKNFETALAALNKPAAGADARPWKGLGFTGWELQGDEIQDGPEGTRYLAKLPFVFELFLEDGTFPAVEPLTVENALKAFIAAQAIA